MTIAIDRPGLVVHQGDALAVLRTLGSESVHCCICSPPYMGLRKYLSPGDPDAALEVGQEATPAAFVARLVGIFREVRRVLRSDGTAWINIGDGYAGTHQTRSAPADFGGREAVWRPEDNRPAAAMPAKNLLLVPERLAISLQDDGWIVRSVIIWSKGSCMPESVRDRPTTSHEYVLMLAKAERYYFDALAIADPAGQPGGTPRLTGQRKRGALQSLDASTLGTNQGTTTRNARTVWEINPPTVRLRSDLTPEQRAYVFERLAAHARRGL